MALNRRRTVFLVAAALLLIAGGVWSVYHVWLLSGAPIALSESIRRGDLAAVERYLTSGGSPDAEIEIHGQRMTLLKEAIFDRETAIAIALLDAGADFTTSGARLIEVGANGMTELVDRLLPSAAVGNVALTGVGNAAGHGYFDTVQSYIRFAEGRLTDEWAYAFGDAAFGAMLGGYDDVARALIDAGAHSPAMLHNAAAFSSPGMVRHLLANGADPNAVFELTDAAVQERTPVEVAWKGYKERVALEQERGSRDTEYLRGRDAEYVLFELLRAGGQVDDPELRAVARDGLSEIWAAAPDAQLMLAARIGYFDVVMNLLDRQTWTSAALRGAVIAALESDHDDVARMLLDRGAPIDGGVLNAAANASSPGLVRDLLRKGADPAERISGKTPVESWFTQSSTQDPAYVLHELIMGGADACWLRAHERELRGNSATFLRDSAPWCWDSDSPSPR
jgi:hypothetical protein